MAAIPFDQFAANARAQIPDASDDELRAAYERHTASSTPPDQRRDYMTHGPTREQFAENVRAKIPDVTDDELEQAYTTLVGKTGVMADVKRAGAYGYARNVGGWLERMARTPAELARNGGQAPTPIAAALERRADRTAAWAEGVQERNAPSTWAQERPWYSPGKLATGVADVGTSIIPSLVGGASAKLTGATTKGAAAVGGLIGGNMEAAGAREEMLREGMDPAEAALRSSGYGAGSAALNTIPLARLPLLGGGGSRTGTGIAEAVTETAEGPLQAIFSGKIPNPLEDPAGAVRGILEATAREAEGVAAPSFLVGAALGGGEGQARAPKPSDAEVREAYRQRLRELGIEAPQAAQEAPGATQPAAGPTVATPEQPAHGRWRVLDDGNIEFTIEDEKFREYERGLTPEARRELAAMFDDAQAYLPQYTADVVAIQDAVSPGANLEVRTIQKAVPGGYGIPPLKGWDRIVEKLVLEERGNPKALKDFVRSTIFVRNPAEAQAALDAVLAKFGQAVGTNTRRSLLDAQPDDFGYADIKVNVPGPNGRIYEIQITAPELFDLKENGGHKFYKEARSMIGKANAEGRIELTPEERKRYWELAGQSQEHYRPGYVGFWRPVFDVAANPPMVGPAGRPSRLTTAPLAGTQPSSVRSAQEIPSGPITNERPSISQGVQPGPGTNVDLALSTSVTSTPSIAQPRKQAIDTNSGKPTRILVDGKRIPAKFVVVEADRLLSSDQAGFPEAMQPRQRNERAASSQQVEKIVNEFEPAYLGEQPEAQGGSPVVAADGTVLSGNGRVIALRRVYQANDQRAEAYRAHLASLGYAVEGMRNPVLVRVPDNGLADPRAFVVAANKPAQAAMSATETALTDAELLTPEVLAKLDAGAALDSAANSTFVRAFLGKLAVEERGTVMGADGRVSAAGLRRIEGALLARAYGGTPNSNELLNRALEDTSDNARTITGAMLDAAPEFAHLRQGIAEGRVEPGMDLAPALVRALEKLSQLRATGKTVAQHLATPDMLGGDEMADEFLRAFYKPNLKQARSRGHLGEYLAHVAREAQSQGATGQMFEAVVDPVELLEQSRELLLEGRSELAASRPDAPAQGLTIKQLRKILGPVLNRLAPETRQKIYLLEHAGQLPPHLLRDIGPDVEGLINMRTGEIWLIARNIKSPARARSALAHELVGHLGLKKMLGTERFNALVQAVRKARFTDPAIKESWAEVERRYPNQDSVTRAIEVLAVTAEKEPTHTLVRRIKAMLRYWIRVNLELDIELTQDDLVYMLHRAAEKLMVRPEGKRDIFRSRSIVDTIGYVPPGSPSGYQGQPIPNSVGAQDPYYDSRAFDQQGRPIPEGQQDMAGLEPESLTKEQQKAWDATQPEPTELPQDPGRYFLLEGSTELPLSVLVPSKSRADVEKSGRTAAKRMRGAYDFKLTRRPPITVEHQGDGYYRVLDGNSTLAAAQMFGWTSLPVQIKQAAESVNEAAGFRLEQSPRAPMSQSDMFGGGGQQRQAPRARAPVEGQGDLFASRPTPMARSGASTAGATAPTPRAEITSTPEFKAWFRNSKVINPYTGEPAVVYHGTTHDFDVFKGAERGLVENHFGKTNYFTTNPGDVSDNYAREDGPDLSGRIALRAEQLESEIDELPPWGSEERKALSAELRERAKAEIAGPTRGLAMPVYLSIQKPVALTPSGGSSIDFGNGRYNNLDKDAGDITGRRFLHAVRRVLTKNLRYLDDTRSADEWGRDPNATQADTIVGALREQFGDRMVDAYQVDAFLRDQLSQAQDEMTGEYVTGDLVRQVWETAGFDGIKLDAYERFGRMVTPGTWHWHATKPTQIKSATGNRGTWSSRNPSILASQPAGSTAMGRSGTATAGATAPPQAPAAPAGRVDVGGGSYSLEQFGQLQPGELKLLERVLGALDAPVKGERRGTQTWDATERKALDKLRNEFGIVLDSLVNRRPGTTANAEMLEAYGAIINSATRDLRDAAEAFAKSNSAQDGARLAAARERLGVMLAPAMGYRSEAGRSLNILRKMASDFQDADAIFEAMGDGSAESLKHFARQVNQAGSVQNVLQRTIASYKPTLWDQYFEFWINSLLSGPWTHAVNMTSNLLFNALELGAELATAAVSRNLSTRAVLAKMSGQLAGRHLAIANAGKAFLTEDPQLTPRTQAQTSHGKAIPGKAGRIVRLPGRALMAEDEFAKAIAYTGEIYKTAMERALSANPSNPQAAFKAELAKLANDKAAQARAKAAADRLTFQTPLGTVGNLATFALNKSKVGRLIVPFIRTPANILKRAMEYTPAAFAMPTVKERLKMGGQERDLVYGRVAIGSTVMLGVMAMVAQGIITGAGPGDERERQQWMRTGRKPYSIKVGDTWYRYNRFEPLGMLLGIAADLGEIGRGVASDAPMSEKLEQAGVSLVMSLALNLGDKTFLRGVVDFTQAYSDPKRYLAQWAQGMAGSNIPNVLAQTARATDPFVREARGLVDSLKARVPGLRSTLPAQRDIAGEKIERGIVEPLGASSPRNDPLAETMLELGVGKGKPSRKITMSGRELELNGQEYESMVEYVQGVRWRKLTPFVRSSEFQALMRRDSLRAAAELERRYDKLGNAAREAWLRNNPAVLIKLRTAPGRAYAPSQFATQGT